MLRHTLTAAAAAAALAVALPAAAATVTVQKAWNFKAAAAGGLEVDNLLGNVVVERHAEPHYHVTATVVANGADDAAARRLAEALRFDTRDSAAAQALIVRWPLDDYEAVYWPDAPRLSWLGGMGTEYLGRRVKLSGDRDQAADVRVDLRIRVPAEARLAVRNPLGSLQASGVQGELRFDSAQAPQSVRDSSGNFTLDTGSGDVRVERVSGRVAADTGSGDVEVRECDCRLSADTGSGGVKVLASAGSLAADTGSGDVTVERFKGTVNADTGSGDVRVVELSGAAEFDADTGSGSVRVQGDLAALRRLRIDTGSGSVDVQTVTLPSMELVIDTGSGRISIDAPSAATREDADGRRVVVLGRGEGRGVIDTGSGSVTFRLADTGQGPAN